jgi:hypothetical protein
MAHSLIDHAFYEAIVHFDESEEAQDYYYKIMDTETDSQGKQDTLRNRILRAYAMLFCDELELKPGQPAGPDEVEATADRLYTGGMGLDPAHWYRMRHHFPVIDDDNYDRFAALVISDLSAGPLREAALHGGDMLLLGEADPLHMTYEQRQNQQVRTIDIGGTGQ